MVSCKVFPKINCQHQYEQRIILNLVDQAVSLLAQLDFIASVQVTV